MSLTAIQPKTTAFDIDTLEYYLPDGLVIFNLEEAQGAIELLEQRRRRQNSILHESTPALTLDEAIQLVRNVIAAGRPDANAKFYCREAADD